MQECKPWGTPIAKGDKFTLSQCPKENLEIQEMQKIPYALAIGSPVYAQVCLHPDIAFIFGMLGRYMRNPRMDNWKAIKKVMWYL